MKAVLITYLPPTAPAHIEVQERVKAEMLALCRQSHKADKPSDTATLETMKIAAAEWQREILALAADLPRLFTLSAKYRGGWIALSASRQLHHAVQDRFREHQLRAFWSLVAPQDNPHPVLERHG